MIIFTLKMFCLYLPLRDGMLMGIEYGIWGGMSYGVWVS